MSNHSSVDLPLQLHRHPLVTQHSTAFLQVHPPCSHSRRYLSLHPSFLFYARPQVLEVSDPFNFLIRIFTCGRFPWAFCWKEKSMNWVFGLLTRIPLSSKVSSTTPGILSCPHPCLRTTRCRRQTASTLGLHSSPFPSARPSV